MSTFMIAALRYILVTTLVMITPAWSTSLAATPALPTTYYIDASSGNDRWSGRIQTPLGSPAADGPWQTLAKLATIALVPGDNVLLRCGQTWYEPLRVSRSGNSTSPITIGAYPIPCATKPKIDGSTTIPAHNWTLHSGNIYRAILPVNLLSNGALDSNLTGWRKYSAKGDAVMVLSQSCGASTGSCLAFTSGTGAGNSVVYSDRFPIDGGVAYTASFSINAPAGARIWTIVRRNGAPYEALGLSQLVIGTGTWQSLSLTFRAARTLPNARLDFEVPNGAITVTLDGLRIEPQMGNVKQVFVSGQPQTVAHHPNRSHDPHHPQSLYLRVATDSDRVLQDGKYVSTYVTTGSDLILPFAASLQPRIHLHARTSSYIVDERAIGSVVGQRIYLDRPTTLPLTAGSGYYLTGALWMLDEPGEWHYDANTRTLHAWMPDGAPPGNRVAVGHADYGIDLNGTAYVVIDGLAVNRTAVGVRMRGSVAVVVRNSAIGDTLREGIDAVGSRGSGVESNSISRTGWDAVSAHDSFGLSSRNLRVIDNEINDSGVRVDSGTSVSLPDQAYAAIRPGQLAYVARNRILNAAYNGIWPLASSTIVSNYVEGACLVLDDCGAIYLNGADHNSTVSNNTVVRPIGNTDGKSSGQSTYAHGIYLDDLTSGVLVAGNTVVEADNGIQLHNAANNRIENNTLYGNRRYQIWMQEQSNRLRLSGDNWGNQVAGNRLVPTSTGAALAHETVFADTSAFATYDNNLYSGLLSPRIAAETWLGGGASYTFEQWRAATVRATGIPRNLEANGAQVTSPGYAAFRVIGPSLITNGNFAIGSYGWLYWNENKPDGTLIWEFGVPGHYLRYFAGASASLLWSPNFSVRKDQWYRATYDLRTGEDGQAVTVAVRRGGGGNNGYEWLMPAPETVTGSTSWKRFSFVFKATQTVNANDPVTLDKGARLQFERVQPGQNISIANVELVPLTPAEASIRTRILLNPDASAAALACPDEQSAPALCSQYVRIADALPVSWPISVAPWSSEIVYAIDKTLADSDGDGIANAQDTCPASPSAIAVNSAGCTFSQNYP